MANKRKSEFFNTEDECNRIRKKRRSNYQAPDTGYR